MLASLSRSAVPETHAEHELWPLSACVPAEQDSHGVAGSESVSAEPAGHGEHTVEPPMDLSPEEHAWHGVDGSESWSANPAAHEVQVDAASSE